MRRPARIYPNTDVKLSIDYEDEDGTLVNPTTVVLKWMDPAGTISTYTYGTDSNIARSATGRYYAIVTPTSAGRWHFSWASTGTNLNSRSDGVVSVIRSEFVDDIWDEGDYV